MDWMYQTGRVEILEVALPQDRSAQLRSMGPDDGGVVLYFHSPATSGEELTDAAEAAADLRLRLLCVNRPTIECVDVDRFVDRVAKDVAAVITALGLKDLSILAWSGGAAFALAASARLGPKVTSVHLVSPVPGPLTGPDAVPGQSERLRQVAGTTASSAWVSGPTAFRDYRAVSAPWTFEVETVTQPVTIWSPTEDEIVPPRLIAHLHQRLPNAGTISVSGGHDWLTQNWAVVLSQVPR